MRYFLALAEERHFGRAATRMHVAQPALSQQIKQLERDLGLPLFLRTTRRVELTEAGRRFVGHARAILGDLEHAAADMTAVATGRAGRVSIGFVGTATYDVLPRVARVVRQELPGIDLHLRGELLSPQLLEGVTDRTFDLALLRPDPPGSPAVALRHLRTEPIVAALPTQHPLARRRRIDLALLAGDTLVTHPSGPRSSMHARVLRACAEAGFVPPTVLEVGETATMMVFVSAGLGIALVPEPVRSLALEGVTYVELTDPLCVDLALARRADDLPPAAAQVAEIIAGCVG